MQITQTSSEGLRREYMITVPAGDLEQRVTARLEEMKPKMRLKGFRPGKAPISFLKRQFGKSLLGELVEAAVNEGSQKAVTDNALKLALPPRIAPVGDVGQVVEGKADLQFTVTVDLMPEFDLVDVSSLTVERLTAEVGEDDVTEALGRLADQARSYTPRDAGEAAQSGDALVMDFVGSVDGVEFEGGKAEGFNLTLGSGSLIPGFEDQLIGVKAGEDRDVNVTFPADYQQTTLAGKAALFKVGVKEVKKPEDVALDDALAKKLGLESFDILKERVRDQIKSDFHQASRLHLKRRILDALDQAHSFTLPPAMVETEFENIWNQVEQELKREGKTAADEGKSEDELKAEYRAIAERRVRLGLVLGRIGEQNGINVGADELQRAIAQRARQFPGQEQQVFDYYAKNQQAQAEIRAPLFEDKVVDFIAELAQVTDKMTDRETLFLDPDDAEEKLKG
jgi:trigger factor